MSISVAIALADEVARDLSKRSGGWGRSFVAERTYVPDADLKELDVLKVSAAIGAMRKEPDSRAEWRWEFDIQVGIQFRAGPKTGNEPKVAFDPLILLAEQVSKTYEDERPTLSDCTLINAEFGGPTGLPYLPDHVIKYDQLTSVVTLTFQKYI